MNSFQEVVRLEHVRLENWDAMPFCSAIYFVVYKEEVIYVGKASCLLNRWCSHHRYSEFARLRGEVKIYWTEVSRADLHATEQRMIQAFSPPLNRRPGHWRAPITSVPHLLADLHEDVPAEREHGKERQERLDTAFKEFHAEASKERQKVLSFRLSPKEFEQIEAHAQTLGLTVTQYVRSLALRDSEPQN